jgi:hypothetical protein
MTARQWWKATAMIPGTVAAVALVLLRDPLLLPHLGGVLRKVGPCVGTCSPQQMDRCLGRALCQLQGHPATTQQRQLMAGVAMPLRRALREP